MTTYEQIRCLGSGYFGEVWLEQDVALDRLCAAKYLIRCDEMAGAPGGLFAEARAMAMTAAHPNVVHIYSAEFEAGTPVIRMEYLPDGSLADRYAGAPLPVMTAVKAIEDATRGLEHLHSFQWLHRDVKPANLMLAAGGQVKLSDLGLACHKDFAATAPWGYIAHLPPEAATGAGFIDAVAGDIFATGATAFRLLNGDGAPRPAANPGADLGYLRSGTLLIRQPFLPHIHDKLRRVVRKAMHRDPARRFGSASDLRHALEQARPAVSWRAAQTANGYAWDGDDVHTGAAWRAVLEPAAASQFAFRLERRTASGSFRKSGVDSGRFASHGAAQAHANAVLGRIADTGR